MGGFLGARKLVIFCLFFVKKIVVREGKGRGLFPSFWKKIIIAL